MATAAAAAAALSVREFLKAPLYKLQCTVTVTSGMYSQCVLIWPSANFFSKTSKKERKISEQSAFRRRYVQFRICNFW